MTARFGMEEAVPVFLALTAVTVFLLALVLNPPGNLAGAGEPGSSAGSASFTCEMVSFTHEVVRCYDPATRNFCYLHGDSGISCGR